MLIRTLTSVTFLIALSMTSTGQEPARSTKSGEPERSGSALDSKLARKALQIGQDYRRWGRVDDLSRWAPILCRIPPPSTGRSSEATSGPHGRKLYYVYAKDRTAYLSATEGDLNTPVGQVIVKEAYTAVFCEEGESPELALTPTESPLPPPAIGSGIERPAPVDPNDQEYAGTSTTYAADEGRLARTGEFHGLYLMVKVAEDTADDDGNEELAWDDDPTDRGWVYATIDSGGTVTAAGKIRSCMRCHERAGDGRLFGMKDPQLIVNPFDASKFLILEPEGAGEGEAGG